LDRPESEEARICPHKNPIFIACHVPVADKRVEIGESSLVQLKTDLFRFPRPCQGRSHQAVPFSTASTISASFNPKEEGPDQDLLPEAVEAVANHPPGHSRSFHSLSIPEVGTGTEPR